MIHLSRTTSLASLILGVLILAQGVPLSGQATRRRDVDVYNGRRAAAREVLARFRGVPTAAALGALDLSDSELLAGGVRRLRARNASVAQLITTLRGRSDVVYVEPNYLIEPAAVPNDPYFPYELGLFNSPRPGMDIHAPNAWDAATGSRTGIIAILDSGVDRYHPDLADNLWSAPAPFTVTIGNREIVCPAGTHGFDAITLTCDPIDDHGHGTAMAGIIGAVGNNGIGVTGVNWSTSLMAVKFIDASGLGSYADAIRAIDFAMQVDETFGAVGAGRVRVLSASWRGTGSSQALADAVDRAASRDMLLVAAAGNDGADIDAAPVYPASLTSPNVLTVAATSLQDVREGYSNFGATSVDLAAPGVTYTTHRGGLYVASSGTSDAAALVSGTAALVLSRCTLATPQLKRLLLETVDVIEALESMVATSGRLNAGRALAACSGSNAGPFVSMLRPTSRQVVPHAEPVVLEADAVDADGSVTSVDFYVGATWVGRDTSHPFGTVTGLLPPGTYRLTATATDDAGAATTSPAVWITVWSDVPLSSPWQLQDIGDTGPPGVASSIGDSVVLAGGGADVWGTSDAFSYVYQRIRGDGEIVARVSSLDHVHRWTKSGVMLRETLASDSRHAFVLVSAEKGVAFQRRHETGGASVHTDGGPGAPPAWVKLAWVGETVTASTSSDGTTWQVIATDTISWGADVYVGVAVTSHRAGELAVARFDSVVLNGRGGGVTPGPASLPAGWLAADVGTVGAAGAAHAARGSFTVSATGEDIWGTSDAFHFVYTSLEGDGEILARVAALDGAAPWTKAGVMLRGSLDATSAHAFALLSAGHGAAFQRRVADGELTAHTYGESATAPVWLRLIRHDDVVSAFTSFDGQEWTLIASDTVAVGASALVGLAVTSHDTAASATAIFDSVAVWRPVPPPSLPEGWAATDIGDVATAGNAHDTGSGLSVTGSGADIWDTADAFHFAYTTLPRDGSITARLVSIEHVHEWTKAGVMLRASLHPSAPHVFALASAARGLAFQRRLVPAAPTTHTAGPLSAAPQWLRLVRVGSTVTALTSADGISWLVIASETFAISGPVYAGLAVSSHDAARSATAVFTDVRVNR